jgi:hypothetical protein
LGAARNAGDWLVAVQDESGAWIHFQYHNVVKVIDTRVAWALLVLSQEAPGDHYVVAARRNLDWALSQQHANGWFACAAFRESEDPFTHTLAYTAEGLLESGKLLGEPRYIDAAEVMARALLAQQRANGWLASTYDRNWHPTLRSSCLTGNCQMARIWLEFYRRTGEMSFLEGARLAIAFVAATQDIETPNRNVRGGIAGSYPICGRYERFTYPNWAAKFFLDALLALDSVDGTRPESPYSG